MSEIDDFLSQAVTRDKSDLDDVSNEGVRTIAELATAVQKYNHQLADLESQTKAVKENLRKITDEDLPDMLFSLGVKSFKLEDGSEVSVKQTYGAHIKVDNKPEAHQWLRDNGFDDIIKNTVSCEFKRGEDSSANDFMEMALSLIHI